MGESGEATKTEGDAPSTPPKLMPATIRRFLRSVLPQFPCHRIPSIATEALLRLGEMSVPTNGLGVDTGHDMQRRYKETSLAGPAVHVSTVEC